MGYPWRSSLILSLLAGQLALGQSSWTVRTYGGIDVCAAFLPAFADHANILGGPSGERIEDFQSMFGLGGGIEIHIADHWSLGIDYVSSTRTIQTNPDYPSSGWTFEPSLHMPTIVIRRFFGSGALTYGIGGGFGYHYGSLRAIPPGLVVGTDYSGSGMGLLGQAMAYTAFDESFYGTLAIDVRWSGVSNLADATGREPLTGNGVKATLAAFALALRFGLAYQL